MAEFNKALSDDVVWVYHGVEGIRHASVYKGKEGVMNFFENLNERIVFLDFQTSQYSSTGENLVVLGSEKLKIKCNGEIIEQEWVQIYTIEDGLIVRMEEFSNNARAVKHKTAITLSADVNNWGDNDFPSGYFSFYLRIALGTAYLSSVADRFGVWGAAGEKGVFWGDFQAFMDYTSLLNPYCPETFLPSLSWVVTIIEILLGIFLILGISLRKVAFASGVVLFLFTMGQIAGVGIKAALDYSVYTASAASFLLALHYSPFFSFDAWMLGISGKSKK